jgi:DNA-binding transcriptional ArsR family regulator
MSTDDERWLDERAGPVVRPYVMTSGRAQPVRGKFDLITIVVATGPAPQAQIGLGPEHLAIVRLCQEPLSVAEIAGYLDLPAGTVRVLLGDLRDKGFVTVQEPEPEINMQDLRMYEAVIDGLRAL